MKKSFTVLVLMILLFCSFTLAQTKSLIIPSNALNPIGENTNFSSDTSLIFYAGIEAFTAPVYLPDGAKVVRMVVFFQDAGIESFDVRFYQHNLYSDSSDLKFELTTQGSTSGLRNQSEEGYVRINNTGYKYYLILDFGSASGSAYRLYAVKLIYNE